MLLLYTSSGSYAYYSRIRGRYPWYEESILHKYGPYTTHVTIFGFKLTKTQEMWFEWHPMKSPSSHLRQRRVCDGERLNKIETADLKSDIYGAAMQNQELFIKTDLMDFGAGDLGFIWESDPAKRKAVAKKILPAFSRKATKAKEATVHKWMDLFISRMKELGNAPEGLDMNDVG